MLRVGFGRVDITPPLELGLRMAGNAPWPEATSVTWPLHGRILLADDGDERVAVVCLDLLALPAAEVARLRSVLAAYGDLAPEHILIACTHTHRAPFTYLAGIAAEDDVFAYLDALYPLLADAMAGAVVDLRPAQLYAASTRASGWAFNRRPIYRNGEVGTHGPVGGDGFAGMEDTPDEELRFLLARGPDGETLGGLVGFACHPTVMEDEPVFSADYPGVLTGELEARHGGIFGFIGGASGDVSPSNPTPVEPRHGFGPNHALAMGRALADHSDAAFRTARRVEVEHVGLASTRLQIPQRRPTREEVELALWYLDEAPPNLDESAFTQRIYGHDYTFNDGRPISNEDHVRELLGMWEWQRRAGTRELVEEVEVQTVVLGDVAIVGLPVELFAAFGRHLKAQSPFPDTIIATLANGWHGYVPTLEAFSRGGYEPRLAYSSRLVPEAGDLLTDAALDLLQRLAGPA